MGKYLQIRVSAKTYDPEAVRKAFPRACAAAFPDARATGGESPCGVIEVLETLADKLRVGMLPRIQAEAIEPAVSRASFVLHSFEKALSDWNASEADSISYTLEGALKEIETALDDVNA